MMQDMNDHIMKQTHYGSATRPAFAQARKSAIKQRIEAELRRENDQDKRAELRIALGKERSSIKTEKKYAQMTHILQNMKSGGWGKEYMAPKMQSMTELLLEGGTTLTRPDHISAKSTEYYNTLFEDENSAGDDDEDATRQNAILEQRMQKIMSTDFEGENPSECSVTADMVARAVLSCPCRRTSARDRVVTEMCQALLRSNSDVARMMAWSLNVRSQSRRGGEVSERAHE